MLELLLNSSFPSLLHLQNISSTLTGFTFKTNMIIKRRGKAALPGKAMVTYPYWMKLRTFLARQDPHSGLTEEKLQSNYLKRGAGKPEQTRVAPMPGIDVENLSEEDLVELVTKLASGHKIKYFLDRETGKEEPHVLMHSLSPIPNLAAAVKEPKKIDDTATTSGQRKEVNICLNTICVLILFVQAPGLNKDGKNPLTAIRRSMKKMAWKVEKGQRREEKKSSAGMRRNKNRREAARKLRREQRKVVQGLQQEQNRARQLGQAGVESSSEKKTCLPARRNKTPPQKGLPEGVRKILMAGRKSMSVTAGGERKQAGREEKKASSGGRAERSEVVHETRQERGGKRRAEWKLIQLLKRVMDYYLEEEVKLPSKFANQPEPLSKLSSQKETSSAASPAVPEKVISEQGRCEDVGPEADNFAQMPRHQEQHPSEQARQPPCPNRTVSPTLPSKKLNPKQPKSPPKLSSQEPRQPPCPPLTDDDEEVSATSPSKLTTNQPKSPSSLSHQEPRQRPLPALTDSSDEEEPRTRSRIIRKRVKRARSKTPTLTSDS